MNLDQFRLLILFVTVFCKKTRAKKIFSSIFYCFGLKPEAIEPMEIQVLAIEPLAKELVVQVKIGLADLKTIELFMIPDRFFSSC